MLQQICGFFFYNVFMMLKKFIFKLNNTERDCMKSHIFFICDYWNSSSDAQFSILHLEMSAWYLDPAELDFSAHLACI